MDGEELLPHFSNEQIKEHSITMPEQDAKSRKKFGKKSYRQKRFSISQLNVREKSELNHLVKNFLAHKCSAAGVPYIIRSKSRWRKFFWFATVTVISFFMSYMTFNVIMEYMKHPKMLIREEMITAKLQFPAVTVCSLNPLVNITNSKTSVYKLMELKQLIEKTGIEEPNVQLREDCSANPLCQWSWFKESHHYVKHLCSTELCVIENTTHCACSSDLCKYFSAFTSCNIRESTDHCICSNNLQYKSDLKPMNKGIDYEDPYWLNISSPVREVIGLIRKASTSDLVDIEEALMPAASDLFRYGIKFDNLVLSCSFDGKLCNRENFTVLYHATYGRCYMFNYLGFNPSEEKPAISYNYGSSSGLRLILHIRKQDTIDLLNSETGARIVVHDPYTLPFVQEYGINVRPHDMAAIEVKQSVLNRLEPPYGNCVQDGSHLQFNLTPEQPYSILRCQKACRHHYLMKSCKCTKRTYITGSVFYMTTTGIQFCKVKKTTEYQCMIDTIAKIEQGKILCDCRPPCTEVVYSTKTSSSDLNEKFYKAVKSIQTFSSKNGTHKTINATDTSNLLLGVKVYYSTFQVDIDNEQVSYSWERLIANIGGNLGFFMGLTLITFAEFLEFFWDIAVTSFRKCMESKSRSNKIFSLRRFSRYS